MLDQYYLYVLLISLGVSLAVFPYAIRQLCRFKIGQYIQDDGPKHADKAQTPTCAGVLVMSLLAVLYVLFGGLRSWESIIVLLVFLSFMGVGLVDDVAKLLYKNNNHGLTPKMKLALQAGLAVGALLSMFILDIPNLTKLYIPIGGGTSYVVDLGWFYFPFAFFAFLGATNAYNLTDGLDGLAGGLCIQVAVGFLVLLLLGYPVGVATAVQNDLLLLVVLIMGILLGFLCFNSYPAAVFLGDSGSLSLGAGFVCLAIVSKTELPFALMSAVFIMETLSVIAQVLYFKRTGGQRLFKMAPVHHHFELCGYKEPKIVFCFWILGLIFLLMSICLLV